jgi:hypothetical protein
MGSRNCRSIREYETEAITWLTIRPKDPTDPLREDRVLAGEEEKFVYSAVRKARSITKIPQSFADTFPKEERSFPEE